MKDTVKDELLVSSSEESGSEEDEEAWKLTDEVEKEFFKTLSQIKSKDPKIYQKDVEFFKDVPIPEQNPKEKSKSTPLTLREYERKIVIEKGGELSDEERPVKSITQMSYVEEQRALKNSLKTLMQSDSEYESEAEWGGLFKKRQKTKTEEEKEEENYKEWLKGQKSEAPDEDMAKEMKPLRDFWTNPDLKQEDQFLRDYILNKKFLEGDEDKGDSRVDVSKLLDESEEEGNEDQSYKNYSHRFEEPDQEYIKRYPRVMENSVRRKDDSRRRKRLEIKERKVKEKEKKKAEIKLKQKLKKKEIEQKLEELKQLTGNEKLAFENVLNKDFDIEEHDKAMQKLFNEEFYSQDDPNFNPNGSSGGEGYRNEDEEEDEAGGEEFVDNIDEPQCEDPEFNMDCDYDPTVKTPKENTSRSRRRKDKHRRTTVSEAVKQKKPVFDPATHKSFQEYVDQYYAIDCEDFIGDLPCRFKYRQTTPNSYGLTIEEILAADPEELERWYSIKRIVQLKPLFREKGEMMSFKKRAANEELKRKILPSLYKTVEDKNPASTEVKVESSESNLSTTRKQREVPSDKTAADTTKRNDIVKKRMVVESETSVPPSKRRKFAPDQGKVTHHNLHKNKKNIVNNKKIATQRVSNEKSSLLDMTDARLQAYGIKPKKFRNKLKYNKVDNVKNRSRNNKDTSNQVCKRKNINEHSDGARNKGNIESHLQSTNLTKTTFSNKNRKQKQRHRKSKFTPEKKLKGWIVSKSK